MPKKPDSAPTANPVPTSAGALPRFSRTMRSSAGSRRRSISSATTTIITAKAASSACPSTILPSRAPASAPSMPAPAKTEAQGQRTLPARAWASRLAAAFAATATALVPMARCGAGTPTR